MGHAASMKSRVHPKYKTKYRVSHWAEYDQALVQRGDITLWISLRARHPKSQEAEALIACDILNLMTEIGRPESLSISA
jgi:hypothetical protein